MTIEEAIKHAEEVAEEKEKEGKLLCSSEAGSIGCLECAAEHRQLAEWLRELKQLRQAIKDARREIIDRAQFYDSNNYSDAYQGMAISLSIIDKHIDRHLKEVGE